ncbi:MAG: hypothetical protein HY597_00175 [Candidatus Omnitrophica bacterium]|nr:hypothetical protein [Candidatus Omnitrophota bacterium]
MTARVMVLVACLTCGFVPAGWTKDIQELPRDLATWSTLWMEVPQAVSEETRANGPVQGIVVGPWEGMASMVETVGGEATRGMAQGQTLQPVAARTPFGQYVNGETVSRRYNKKGLPAGPILRYDF